MLLGMAEKTKFQCLACPKCYVSRKSFENHMIFHTTGELPKRNTKSVTKSFEEVLTLVGTVVGEKLPDITYRQLTGNPGSPVRPLRPFGSLKM